MDSINGLINVIKMPIFVYFCDITMLREPRAHVLSQYKMCRSQWVEEFRQATRQKGQHVSWRHKLCACCVVVDHTLAVVYCDTLLLMMSEWSATFHPYLQYQYTILHI